MIDVTNELQKSITLLNQMQQDNLLLKMINDIANLCIQSLLNERKILLIGNGGSAADAQHLAAELVSRLRYNRPGLPGIALTTDTSCLTAIGNDYTFEDIFSRQVEAIGQAGDVLIGISTSGKSPNILKALSVARSKGLKTVGLTGSYAPMLNNQCDLTLNIPSAETQKIQEGHITVGHIICGLIEENIFGAQFNPQLKSVG